jgi:membrane-bound serine protease (ClpP class)
MEQTGMKRIVLFSLMVVLFLSGTAFPKTSIVNLIKVEGIINPVAAEFITNSIRAAEKEGAQCLIIQIDTPGGLDTSMRQIAKGELNAEVPMVVYVAPAGARAASAGVIITMAAHVAAMAPGTNIGAAHPVALGEGKMSREMAEKVENDAVAYIQGIAAKRNRNGDWAAKAVRESVSVDAQEALKLKVIDLVSPDVKDLLKQLDGREVEVGGKKMVLATKDAELREKEMSLRDRILDTLSNPTIAYILMMLGLAGLYFELAHPGVLFPGILGAICLIMAFYSLQTLPVNYAGVLLILLGIGFFLAEIKVASYGLLSVGGTIALLLGSLMLFDSPAPYLRVAIPVVLATVLITAGFFIAVASLAFRAYLQKPTTGSEGLIGMVGVAASTIAPRGKVFVHGEYWNASSEEQIEKGEEVEIIKVEGLKLKVKRINQT